MSTWIARQSRMRLCAAVLLILVLGAGVHGRSREVDTEMEWVYDITVEALKWNTTASGLRCVCPRTRA